MILESISSHFFMLENFIIQILKRLKMIYKINPKCTLIHIETDFETGRTEDTR